MIRLQLIGNLGQDAVEKNVNGTTVLSFGVAHTKRFTNKQGVQQERTIWADCSYWDPNKIASYLTKGRQVFVEGYPTLEVYQRNTGETAAALRLRVTHLQLLASRRPESGMDEELPEEEMEEGEGGLPF
jgi:single-strand DNA-binding protein